MCVHVIYKHTHAHSGEMVHPRPIVTATATHHKRLPIPIKARQIQIDKSVRMNHDSPPLECQGQIRTARHSELSLGPGTPNPYPRPCTLPAQLPWSGTGNPGQELAISDARSRTLTPPTRSHTGHSAHTDALCTFCYHCGIMMTFKKSKRSWLSPVNAVEMMAGY